MEIKFELTEKQTEALKGILEKYPDKKLTPEKWCKGVTVEVIINQDAQLRATELRG